MNGMEWIMNSIERAIEVGNSSEDPNYKVGYMLSALNATKEYLKQLQEDNEDYISDPDPFGVISALNEATRIR